MSFSGCFPMGLFIRENVAARLARIIDSPRGGRYGFNSYRHISEVRNTRSGFDHTNHFTHYIGGLVNAVNNRQNGVFAA